MEITKQLHNAIKYPTTVIVKGANPIGVEIAKSLLDQGGYVIIIDSESKVSRKILEPLIKYELLTVLDFDSILNLGDDLRRLDYVFYLEHKSSDLEKRISSQHFLQFSNYLDAVLDLTAKFDAKFLLTTSIRAHQLNITNKQFDYNYESESQDKHIIYAELEIQRYAESLVKEYEQKVGINARILRMGEILGKGIELESDSHLIRMINFGLKESKIAVPGDGLEKNYYLHYLDAAYGILKAQFAMNTEGTIYTLANPEEITLLAIAYKLADNIPGNNEIEFDEDDDTLPSLLIYKPAENLSSIGWKPRVTFDRALQQTIEYVKQIDIEKEKEAKAEPVKPAEEKIADKLKGFFFIAGAGKHVSDEVSPLDQLIEEQQDQENSRLGHVAQANNDIRESKKNKKDLNPIQRFDIYLHDMLFELGTRFNFLKNITLTDFVITSVFFLAFFVVYLMLIAPLFSLSRNIFQVRSSLEDLQIALVDFDFEQALEDNANLNNNLNEAQARVEDLKYLFSMSGKSDLYIDVQRLTDSIIDYSAGYEQIYYAYFPLQTYLETFLPEITYRFSDSNMLTVTNNDEDYTEELTSFFTHTVPLENGMQKVQFATQEMIIYVDRLPDQFDDILRDRLIAINNTFAQYEFFNTFYPFLNVMLGTEKPVNYLFVVSDNTRYTPSGGAVSGFILLAYDSGNLKQIQIDEKSLVSQGFTSGLISDDVINNINLLSVKQVSKENIVFSDLYQISDQDLYLTTLQSYYTLATEKEIDFVMTLDLKSMEAMLQNSGEIEYRQVVFNDENLLTNIDLLSEVEEGLKREEVIMNVSAKLFQFYLNDIKNNFFDISEIIKFSYNSKHSTVFAKNIKLANMVDKADGSDPVVKDKMEFGINHNPTQTDQLIRFPITNVQVKITVNEDYSTSKIIELVVTGANNLQTAYLCVASGSKDFQDINVKSQNVSTTLSDSKICKIYLQDDNLKYGLDLNTVPLQQDSRTGVYEFGIIKNPGIEANYDIEFTFDPIFSVNPGNEDYIEEEQKYIYSGYMEGDQYFTFELKK